MVSRVGGGGVEGEGRGCEFGECEWVDCFDVALGNGTFFLEVLG